MPMLDLSNAASRGIVSGLKSHHADIEPRSPDSKLIMCERLGDGRRVVTEIAPDDTVAVTCWDGSRQVGKTVQIPLAKAPDMAVLVAAVRQALGEQHGNKPTHPAVLHRRDE